jgi:hypothetical protein
MAPLENDFSIRILIGLTLLVTIPIVYLVLAFTRIENSKIKKIYLLTFTGTAIVLSMIPIMDGGEKFALIQVWWAYPMIVSIIFSNEEGLGLLLALSLSLASIHLVTSFLVAWLVSRMYIKRINSQPVAGGDATR